MNIPVQKNIPGNNQGKPGDMKLVIHPSGMYLYVKGSSAWGSLKLNTKGIGGEVTRNARRILQDNIRVVMEYDDGPVGATWDEGAHGEGTIAGAVGTTGGGGGSGPPSLPDEPR